LEVQVHWVFGKRSTTLAAGATQTSYEHDAKHTVKYSHDLLPKARGIYRIYTRVADVGKEIEVITELTRKAYTVERRKTEYCKIERSIRTLTLGQRVFFLRIIK
jgi:hypothetical protein